MIGSAGSVRVLDAGLQGLANVIGEFQGSNVFEWANEALLYGGSLGCAIADGMTDPAEQMLHA